MVQDRQYTNSVAEERSSPTAIAGDCVALMVALDHLFRVGPVYHATHAAYLEIARRFQSELAGSVSPQGMLRIAVGREFLLVQSQVLGVECRGIARPHELLNALGIARMEIDATASTQDLHALASLILKYKHEADTSWSFRQLDFSGLPKTVRVAQREFGKRPGLGPRAVIAPEQIQSALSSVVRVLDGRELDARTQETCRHMVQQVFAKIVERLDMDPGFDHVTPGGFERPLEDVLDLGVHALRHALTDLVAVGQGQADLQNLFTAAERALALSDDSASVELMLSVLRQAAAEAGVTESMAQQGHEEVASDHQMPLDQLRRRLAEHAAQMEPLTSLELEGSAEQVSILLQMLMADPPPPVRQRITSELAAVRSERIGTRERQLLTSVVRDLVVCRDHDRLDHILPLLIRPLRRTADDLYGELLLKTCGTLEPGELTAIWPHLVNEILCGLPNAAPQVAAELYRIAGQPEAEAMAGGLQRLERLDTLREKRFATSIFRPPPPELYPVFAVLLNSSKGRLIGKQLYDGFHAHPPNWVAAQVLALRNDYNPRDRDFLVQLLREGGQAQPSDTLRSLASKIITRTLSSLAAERRGEPWVAPAIDALGRLQAHDAATLLREIRQTRRYLLFHTWPAACRFAARRAQIELQGISHSGATGGGR